MTLKDGVQMVVSLNVSLSLIHLQHTDTSTNTMIFRGIRALQHDRKNWCLDNFKFKQLLKCRHNNFITKLKN